MDEARKLSDERQERPSVGRIVHFHYADAGPIAALVTEVLADGKTCTLTLFHSSLMFEPAMRKEAVEFAKKPTAGHWSWPPRV